MKRYLAMGLALLVTSTSLPARDLSLAEALELAQQHSHNLKKSAANAEAAAGTLRATRAERLPTLSLNSSGYYVSVVPQLTISLPGATMSRDMGVHENYQNDLRLSFPLFTGGRISSAIAASTSALEINEALLSADRARLDYQTSLEYFGLAKAGKLLESAQSEFERTKIINTDVQSLYAGGVADSSDLLEAAIALQRATLAVDQSTTNRRAAEIRLVTLLGLDPGEMLNPVEFLSDPVATEPAREISPTKPELRAAEAGIKLQSAYVQQSRSDYFPTLGVYGGYSYGRPNLDRFNNTWNDNWVVGANLSWSLNLGGKTSNKTRASKYALTAAQSERDQVRENLNRDLRLAHEQLKLAFQRYRNSQIQFRLSSDNFRLSQEKLRNGTMSANRLLEVEADLSAADSELAAALVDYYLARSAYLYIAGFEEMGKGN